MTLPGGPLRPQLLRYILCYLFPDSEPSPAHPYLEEAVEEEGLEYYRIPAKTCPVEGLCWRLCTTVACCLGWAGAAGVAHLLHEFCMEIRYITYSLFLLVSLPVLFGFFSKRKHPQIRWDIDSWI